MQVGSSSHEESPMLSVPDRALTVSALSISLLLGACAGMSEGERSTAIGASLGAIAGGVIGDSRRSALIGAGVGALGGYLWSNQAAQRKAAMERAAAGTGAEVTQTADNQLRISLPSDITFDAGRAEIRPEIRPVLDELARNLRTQPATTVRVVGHSDNSGGDAVNDPLSVNRAARTRDYLVARGVDARRILIDGRGSREPVADNGTESGRALNRRVEILVGEPARG
jgi:outer membrane protein OmpA-like peptidoglycan-associated protein